MEAIATTAHRETAVSTKRKKPSAALTKWTPRAGEILRATIQKMCILRGEACDEMRLTAYARRADRRRIPRYD